MKLKCVSFFMLLILSACSSDPVKREQSTNSEIKVDVLFDYDGCRAYRFYDDGAKYLVKCGNSGTTSWDTKRLTGKMVYTEHHSIQTAEVGEYGIRK